MERKDFGQEHRTGELGESTNLKIHRRGRGKKQGGAVKETEQRPEELEGANESAVSENRSWLSTWRENQRVRTKGENRKVPTIQSDPKNGRPNEQWG
jgi:hypothetical protein